MVRYRRARIPGASYFFTVTLRDRRSDLLTRRAELLRQVLRGVRRERPFAIDAVVVLPDHLHTLWTLPPGDRLLEPLARHQGSLQPGAGS